ncbi:hypothetical protein ACIQNG_33675 [Streptomyces sp. NPDC091377]|uniref:hypothetical protein n=1 Tax=Streptomyces sp. NPDC091377 TaxID=3365995 RepID=UPI0037FA8048
MAGSGFRGLCGEPAQGGGGEFLVAGFVGEPVGVDVVVAGRGFVVFVLVHPADEVGEA